jgi:hypothetical protein
LNAVISSVTGRMTPPAVPLVLEHAADRDADREAAD